MIHSNQSNKTQSSDTQIANTYETGNSRVPETAAAITSEIKASELSKTNLNSMLRSKGIPPTSQRMIIAEQLLSKHQHVTADQLHETLCQTSNRVSKATVYNTLGLFVQKGLIREIFINGCQSYYDSNTSPHHHIYNVDSGELFDINDSLSQYLENIPLPPDTSIDCLDVVVRIKNQA